MLRKVFFWRIRRRHAWIGGAVVLGVTLGAWAWIGCTKPTLSPQDADMLARYKAVENEMTEQEIDIIFAGMEVSKEEGQVFAQTTDNGTFMSGGQRPLRPASWLKTYLKQPAEGHYAADIYFDYFGKVVGKKLIPLCN
jgi:hypothetical protein